MFPTKYNTIIVETDSLGEHKFVGANPISKEGILEYFEKLYNITPIAIKLVYSNGCEVPDYIIGEHRIKATPVTPRDYATRR